MKIRHTFNLVPALALTAGMMIWGGTLNAQTSPADTQAPAQSTQQPQPDTPPTQATPPSQSQAPDQAVPAPTAPTQDSAAPNAAAAPKPDAQTPTSTDAQAFTGTVVKSGDKYVLQEDGGKTYDVDHQDAVQKFEGKRVKVHGTLDATGKTILLQ